MKHLAVAAAALFFLAAPGMSFAQSDNGGGNNGGGASSGNNNGATTNGGNGGGNDSTGSVTQNSSKAGSCSHQSPGSFNSFNEECRREIEIWAQKQNGKGVDYSGDLAEGTELPGSVEFTEVPAYPNYGYAMLNGKRVLIDRETRKVIRVY